MHACTLSTALVHGIAPWIATGALLGLGAAVPPGPVNLEIARRGVRGAFWPAACVGLGAVSVDVLLALLLGLGWLHVLNLSDWLRLPIITLGILLLAYLGVTALRSMIATLQSPRLLTPLDDAGITDPLREVVAPLPMQCYLNGVLICSTSHYSFLFWLSYVPSVLPSNVGTTTSAPAQAGLALGVLLATLAWVLAFSSLTTWLGGVGPRRRLTAAMDGVGGVLLLAFAALSGWRLARSLL